MDRFVKRNAVSPFLSAPGAKPKAQPNPKKRGRPASSAPQSDPGFELPAKAKRKSAVSVLEARVADLEERLRIQGQGSQEAASSKDEELRAWQREKNASAGWSGAKAGHLGGAFGHLGGRPSKAEGESYTRLGKEAAPKRLEPSRGGKQDLVRLIRKKAGERGIEEDSLSTVDEHGLIVRTAVAEEFLSDLVHEFFRNRKKVRDLWRAWKARDKLQQAISKDGNRLRGAKGKGQRRAGSYQLHKNSVRALGGGRVSLILPVYETVRSWFETRRAGGVYVDRTDLWIQLLHELRQAQDKLTKQVLEGGLSIKEHKLKFNVDQKLRRLDKNYEKTAERCKVYMMKLFGARLLKPQRLLSIPPAEEKKRYLSTVHFSDYMLSVACFGDEALLAKWINKPAKFIRNRRLLVISHSDQVPMLVKIQSGRQLFAAHEVQQNKNERNEIVVQPSQALAGQHDLMEDDKGDEVLMDMDGQTQLRGEGSSASDKYRVTIDFEILLLNYADESAEPEADLGTVTCTLPGTHCDVQNICPETETYIEDEKYVRAGAEKFRKAGSKVHPQLAKSLRKLLYKDSPELRHRLRKNNIRLFQQDAGFEDSYVCVRKLQHQAQIYPCLLSTKDLAGCQTSEACKETACAVGILESWIEGQMSAVMQMVDTGLAFRAKAILRQVHDEMRGDLMRLAAAEGASQSYKCGYYEILTSICEMVERLRVMLRADRFLLREFRRNGYLALRPSLSKGRFELSESQAWCHDDEGVLKQGSHRIRQGWLDERLSWLTEEGLIRPPALLEDEGPSEKLEAHQSSMSEHSYHGEGPGCSRGTLNSWSEMAEAGELTPAQIKDMREETWFELEVLEYEKQLDEAGTYKEYLKTPKQLRRELGISEHHTSQCRSTSEKKKISDKHKKYRAAMRPVRQERLKELRHLKDLGYSNRQIAQTIIPGYKPKLSKMQLKAQMGGTLSGKTLASKIKGKLKTQLKNAVKGKLGGKPEAPVSAPPVTHAAFSFFIYSVS